MGMSLLYTGEIAEGRAHLEQATALYDPAKHRSLATRFGQDARVHALCYLSWALWFLGYPEAALAAADSALSDAREIGQAATSMTTLTLTSFSLIFCGNYAAANAQSDELIALADEKGALDLEVARNIESRLAIGLDRQSLERSRVDHRRDHCVPVNGLNKFNAAPPIIFGDRSRGTRSIR